MAQPWFDPPSSFASASERRRRFSAIHGELESVEVMDVAAWSAGATAQEMFGRQSDVLESLALVKALRDQCDFATRYLVASARGDGWSWDDIAAALGVSRQAVMKRFPYLRH